MRVRESIRVPCSGLLQSKRSIYCSSVKLWVKGTESKLALRTWENIEEDSQYTRSIQAHVNCLPLNVNEKRNHELGCKRIEKKAEQRSTTVNQTALAGMETRLVARFGTTGCQGITSIYGS